MGDAEERCPLNPSLRKFECSHCQGTAPGTADNPHFSLKEGEFDGFPVVEVLKDGGSIGSWDEHFRFGQRKAEMLVTCTDILRNFWLSTYEERLAFASQIVENQKSRLRIKVSVEMRPDFELSTGQTINRPWLRLQALPPDTDHIGLGALKCRAICAVQEQLQWWLLKHRVLRLADRLLESPRNPHEDRKGGAFNG